MPLRSKLGVFWRFRPRVLTLALLAVIAAMIVLANLTDEISRRGPEVLGKQGELYFSLRDAGAIQPDGSIHGLWSLSYGWPLLWRQYILSFWLGPSGVLGDCYSPRRLALNLTIWLVMLAAPATASEWLLRRHPPRFRWNLRSMLAGMGLAAAVCGWYVAARKTADVQDAVIAAEGVEVWLERWGPRWLDLVGADRYRRRIVGAKLDLTIDLTDKLEVDEEDFKRKKELLARLASLHDLRYLYVAMEEENPSLVDALKSMRQLRVLSIKMDDGLGYYGQQFSPEGKRHSHDCLMAIGAMSDLEHLSLSGMPIVSESLACLASLANLRSLHLHVNQNADKEAAHPPLLSRLPVLPRVEAVDLEGSYVGDRGLRYLSVLPRLKTLNLTWTDVTEFDLADLPNLKFDAGLAEIARLESLEEVTVRGEMSSATGLESLLALKRLKKLHIGIAYLGRYGTGALLLDHGDKAIVLQVEVERCRRALDALRKANPRIVIDGQDDATDWPGERLVPSECETIPPGMLWASAHYSLDAWKKGSRLNRAFWPKPLDTPRSVNPMQSPISGAP